MFRERLHLAKGGFVAHGNEHRVVAEALAAARRPDKRPVDASFESFGLTVVGPGDRQRADEVCGGSRVRRGRLGFGPDLFHRARPVAVAFLVFGPACRKNPGTAVKGVDAEAAVIGEGGQAAEVSRFAGLEVGIVGKGVADLVWFGKIEFRGAETLDAERLHQRCDFAKLARVMGGNDELVAKRPHRPVACSWAAKMSPHPMRARRSRRSKPSSSKVSPSAVS